MFICDNCGKEFETPKRYREDMNGEGMYDEFLESPCCGDSYSEAVECAAKHCENYVGKLDICDDCFEKISMKLFVLEKEFGLERYDFTQILEEWIERNW